MSRTVSDPPDDFAPVGRVGKTHGLKGSFRLQYEHAPTDSLAPGDLVWVEGLGEATVASFEPRATFAVMQLDRVRDVDHARLLLHHRVYTEAAASNLQTDAVGMPVMLNGQTFGRVTQVLGNDAHPLVEVETEPEAHVLIPAVAPYVHWRSDGLHLENPPEGLLPT